ncbi:acyltransferase family protein [Pseudoalteromonas sp. 2CM28B]|uniref:acyltransferase family protein n=1 Tax=Pseudoalteromonas sp. 2CM28B TaxID=2929851 RepID=UPI0020BF476A|nr:acyltransferase family protein [Pseudoalteromonas sp. 2CM28B]MCK8137248.1 acyltransferase family protein [Pseudoalteromonas sp. 2CM28B]
MNKQLHVTNRHYFLDWLRVIAFAVLIFYHIGMLYSENWGFHFKSTYISHYVEYFLLVFAPWRMLLIWFISGVALRFMLDKVRGVKSNALFVLNRSIFILLPLLVGLWLIVPFQLYAEMSQTSGIDITYWQFYLAFLDINNEMFANYQSGVWPHVDVNHLWYLRSLWQFMLIIILFSLFMKLPFFTPLLKLGKVRLPLLVSLLVIAMLLTHNYLEGDAVREANGFIFLFIGYLSGKHNYFWASLKHYFWVLCVSFTLPLIYILMAYQNVFDLPSYIFTTIYNIQRVLGVLTMLALAQHFLNFKTNYLKTFNSWVFPFYLLHQSVLIILCFVLQPLEVGSFIEPLLVVIGTWCICAVIKLIVTRIDILRPLIGVKTQNSYSKPYKLLGYTVSLILVCPLAFKLVF